MNIDYSLLKKFTINNRRAGTTTLLKEISKNNDIYVLCKSNFDVSEHFPTNGVVISSVSLEDWDKKPKPFLVDNEAFRILISDMLNKVKSLESEIKKRDIKISRLELDLLEKEIK